MSEIDKILRRFLTRCTDYNRLTVDTYIRSDFGKQTKEQLIGFVQNILYNNANTYYDEVSNDLVTAIPIEQLLDDLEKL